MYISPWLLGFLFFYLGPILLSFYFSLTRWNLLTDPVFIGFDNYAKMFTRDPLFWKSLRITATYTAAYLPLDLMGGLVLALLLNSKVKNLGIFRTIFYLPSVLSGVAYTVIWMWMLHPTAGLVNTFLEFIGINEPPRWLLDPDWALTALVMMSLWGVGRSMVIFLAGLQDIPESFYEAAMIDGATGWQRFWRITLPLLTPSILFNLLFGVILTFQSFTSVFVATNGGPLDSTLFYVMYLYRQAFTYLNMGYASAMAWVLFLIVLALTVLIFLTSGKWVFYQGTEEGT
ncbi:MAG: sugar ABC transporter permease [Anaerolineae bacterium]|jgi:multiple sugar transport system permease protein|nr:sugar ABC transporter permease [Anaerolineae bacterium]